MIGMYGWEWKSHHFQVSVVVNREGVDDKDGVKKNSVYWW